MRETTRAPRTYELMIIVAPDVPEDELPEVIDRVGGFIDTAGGSITETLRDSPWGRRRLAYAIRHGGHDVRDGFYTVYHFDAPPNSITEIERELRLTDQVMRYLVTHYTPQPVTEQPQEPGEGVEATAPEVDEIETPAVEDAEAPAAAEIEAPADEEAPAVEVAAAPEPEPEAPAEAVAEVVEAEAPAKKPATRRKKVAAPEATEEKTEEPAE